MSRIKLPQVTLCCVDSTARLPWALEALRRSLAQVEFGDAFLCTDRASLGEHRLPAGVRWVEIEPLLSIEAYSEFMIKALVPHVQTTHLLVIQWDGFVLSAAAWRDDFLGFDYIGAPWNHIAEPFSVGNGGFSLRSKHLLQALQEPRFAAGHPEDICICVTHRAALEALGLRFAPKALAQQFAVEDDELTPRTFGFHGAYHLPKVLTAQQTLAFVDSLGPGVLVAHSFGRLLRELRDAARKDVALKPAFEAFERLIRRALTSLQGPLSLSPQATGVCKELVRHGQFDAARQLLDQRRTAQGRTWADTKLRWRLALKQLTTRHGAT